MNPVKLFLILFVVASAWFPFTRPIAFGDELNFAIIQPGQPGSPKEAQPVMDALAAYLQKKMGTDCAVKGVYFNELDPALAFLHNEPPTWGIVRLGFYAEHARAFQMTALASTRPGGHDTDIWRLVVSTDGPGDWKALKGTVLGNMLFEKDAASCLLFDLPSNRLPFTLKGTFRPLSSLRRVIRGKVAGVVLDRSQYEAAQALPLMQNIAVVHTSQKIPASPVIWFGKTDNRTRELTRILLQMKEDRDAQTLLKLLQTDGFGPADPDLPRFRRGENGAACFP